MAAAAFLVTSLLVAAVAAFHLLKGRRDDLVKKSFSMALWMLLFLAPAQILIGDMHGLNTLHHQPAKLAAIEGHWETNTDEGMPLYLFGMPDMEDERTKYAIGIPNLGSLIMTHSLDGQVKGLKEFAPEDRPNSLVIFWSFRIMVGLGVLMVLLALATLILRKGGKLYEHKLLQRFALLMGPTGFIALLAGWFTTEVGRQPWVVYGVLRTKDALSPVSAEQVGLSLVLFVFVYFIVFGIGIYYMLKLMHKGPEFIYSNQDHTDIAVLQASKRPLSSIDDAIEQIEIENKQRGDKHND